jgi:hypothetical protein
VPRPKENGPNTTVDEAPESYITMMANDSVDLAAKLMAPWCVRAHVRLYQGGKSWPYLLRLCSLPWSFSAREWCH